MEKRAEALVPVGHAEFLVAAGELGVKGFQHLGDRLALIADDPGQVDMLGANTAGFVRGHHHEAGLPDSDAPDLVTGHQGTSWAVLPRRVPGGFDPHPPSLA